MSRSFFRLIGAGTILLALIVTAQIPASAVPSAQATSAATASSTPSVTVTPIIPPTAAPMSIGGAVPITATNAAQVKQVALLGRGFIEGDAQWSPDGKRIAVVTSIGIWLYDAGQLSAEPNLMATT